MKILLTCIAILVSTQGEAALKRFGATALGPLKERVFGEPSGRIVSSLRYIHSQPQPPRDNRFAIISTFYMMGLGAIFFDLGGYLSEPDDTLSHK